MENKYTKASRQERAKMFMPFAALRGYYQLIKEQSRKKEVKRELSDDELLKLDNKLNEIKKGMMIKITYYKTDAYETITGLISNIDLTFHTITIVKTKIKFNDISDIELIS
jgi:hypothetical protein